MGRGLFEKIAWCKKKGIKTEQPNDDLAKAYLIKAKSGLNMLEAARERKEIEWICTTGYYARYFSFYALLQKCGIMSEIHECTIALLRYLFVEEGIIEAACHLELEMAKDLRIDTQYFTADYDLEEVEQSAKSAGTFVLKMEETMEALNPERIRSIREKLEKTRR